MLLARIAEKSGPSAANRVRACLSAFFSLAGARRPARCQSGDWHQPRGRGWRPRSRVLTDAELVEIWKALGDDQYSAIVRLLILTGARRDEIGSLAGPKSISTAP